MGSTFDTTTVPPQLKLWMDLSEALAVAAFTGARRLQNATAGARASV